MHRTERFHKYNNRETRGWTPIQHTLNRESIVTYTRVRSQTRRKEKTCFRGKPVLSRILLQPWRAGRDLERLTVAARITLLSPGWLAGGRLERASAWHRERRQSTLYSNDNQRIAGEVLPRDASRAISVTSISVSLALGCPTVTNTFVTRRDRSPRERH